jgi:hypothetical protein
LEGIDNKSAVKFQSIFVNGFQSLTDCFHPIKDTVANLFSNLGGLYQAISLGCLYNSEWLFLYKERMKK